MIKYYCDNCKKETSPLNLFSIEIKFDVPPTKIKHHAHYKRKKYELCESCLTKRVEILEALIKDWA